MVPKGRLRINGRWRKRGALNRSINLTIQQQNTHFRKEDSEFHGTHRKEWYDKGNNKITELRTILQRESQNS